jgi:xanthine dehydrogenase accessory factor
MSDPPPTPPSPLPDVPRLALEWVKAGRQAVLVTVTSTWGSSPRPAGSQLVVRDDQHFEGSVSGGCIEGDVLTVALDIMAGGKSKLLQYGVTNDEAWEVGLACGGRIGVYLQPVEARLEALLEDLNSRRLEKKQVAMATVIESGHCALYSPGEALEIADADLTAEAEKAIRADRPHSLKVSHKEVFLNVFNPPLRLFVIGAVHIAQALVPMAELAGFEVTVVDPRGVFANQARLGAARLVEDWPDDVLKAARLDQRSAVITLTHDPKLDDAALAVALKSEAFYIGSLGSNKTHAARLARLKHLGFDEATLDRIHGPLGLDIGARTPGEIATSALAQAIATLRAKGS